MVEGTNLLVQPHSSCISSPSLLCLTTFLREDGLKPLSDLCALPLQVLPQSSQSSPTEWGDENGGNQAANEFGAEQVVTPDRRARDENKGRTQASKLPTFVALCLGSEGFPTTCLVCIFGCPECFLNMCMFMHGLRASGWCAMLGPAICALCIWLPQSPRVTSFQRRRLVT